jgi:dCTP deaminase
MQGAVLSKDRIQHELDTGIIKIEQHTVYDGIQQIEPIQLQPAGIDLTLSHSYRRYKLGDNIVYYFASSILIGFFFSLYFKLAFIDSIVINTTIANLIDSVWTKFPRKIILKNGVDYKKYTKLIQTKPNEKITIRSGETILGITQEHIKLPTNICGILNGRSRFARMGLCIHITALFINPGVDNQTVLEIRNDSPYNLELVPGERICQLILMNIDGEAEYQGQFNQQSL